MDILTRRLVYIFLIYLVETARKGHGACTVPDPVAGTRHNGTLIMGVYDSGAVLVFSCNIGYKPNYNDPTSRCLDDGSWYPPNVTCSLDIVSLVLAVVVAIVAILAFIVATMCIVRKLKPRRNPKNKRRSPQFPEHPPLDISTENRQVPLYNSINFGNDHTAINNQGTDTSDYDYLDRGPIPLAGSGGSPSASQPNDVSTAGKSPSDAGSGHGRGPNLGFPDEPGGSGSDFDVVEPVVSLSHQAEFQHGRGAERSDSESPGVLGTDEMDSKRNVPGNSVTRGDQKAVQRHSYENVKVGADVTPDYENIAREKLRKI